MENIDEKISDELFEKASHGDKAAFHELEKLAEDGNEQAISHLAQIYLKGFGVVESSYKKALELFRKAASLNDAYALFRLGEFYRDAKCGLEQDGHIAAEFFIKAAQYTNPKGVAKCLNLAAEIYHYGEGGMTPDAQKAIELYEKLAEMESRGEAESEHGLTGKALFKLAEIYTEGCGNLKPDAKKAIEYLNKAYSRYGYLRVYKELAELYREDKAGIKPDGYKVIEYLTKLEDLEGIAEIYRDGKYNVKADGYKAIEYFLERSETGFLISTIDLYDPDTLDKTAENFLQNPFHYGDYENAVKYYSYSREFRTAEMFQKIAEIYLKGQGGVRPDGYDAIRYLSKASENVNRIIDFTKELIENSNDIREKRQELFTRIFCWLGRINENISEQIAEIYSDGKAGVQPDGNKAIKYFLKAIEAEHDNPAEDSKDNISAIFHKIAWIYLEGRDNVQIDGYKAIEYFEKCSNFEKIAEIYRDGKAGVEPDPKKAIEYFLKYESTIRRPQNSDDIINDLTIFFDNEERASAFGNIAQIYSSLNDGQKALDYYLKADELGDSWASDEIERIYREGKGNLKPDGVKLVEFLTKKLEQLESPDDSILYDIAEIYEEGCYPVEPDMNKALKFYRDAAKLGNFFAERKLLERVGKL